MFNFDKDEIQRVALAAIGTVILTTVSVGAAVGPARAIETSPLTQLQAVQVAHQAHA
jgi:hypothetical protein